MLAAVKTMPAMVAGGLGGRSEVAAKRHVLAAQVQTGSRLCTPAHSERGTRKIVLDSTRYAWNKGTSRRAGLAVIAQGIESMQEGRNGNLDGLKVMVIDDSKTIRRTAETLLKREGCDVVTATDGFEALAKIADQQPQIIFVDIMMPRLDGYQTCALIKNNHLFKNTPVIMLSSKDGLFDKARGRIVGSEQYLTKPFTREELLDAIRNHVHDSARNA
jgi:twitching motility two-component system response regulator PilG